MHADVTSVVLSPAFQIRISLYMVFYRNKRFVIICMRYDIGAYMHVFRLMLKVMHVAVVVVVETEVSCNIP